MAPDGCSPDYLVGLPEVESVPEDLLMLKLLMPTTFIHSDTPDLIYLGYQVQELTVDTITNFTSSSATPYGINSRQLNDYKDADGYACVFLAPEEFVENLRTEQGTPEGIPPVYTWEGVTGYMLVKGTVVIRHRGSSADWEGNLINTPCYLTNAEAQPIDPDLLGGYCPTLVGLSGPLKT